MKYVKIRGAFLTLCVLAAAGCGLPAAADTDVVYVAGNPQAYPMEYFEPATGQYEGVIPELLRQYSASSGYQLQYLDSRHLDERKRKYKNKQAELISGCVLEDDFPAEVWQEGIVILGGTGQEYRILFSDIAGDTLKQELTAFLNNVPKETIAAMLVEVSKNKQPASAVWPVAAAIGAGILAVVLLILAVRARKKIKRLEEQSGIDIVTGIGNYEFMARYFKQRITDKNRILYHIVYFYFDGKRLRHAETEDKTDDFLKQLAVALKHNVVNTDIAARVSKDGFAVLKLSASVEKTQEWASAVLETLKGSVYKSAVDDVFVGIYCLKSNDWDLDKLLFDARQGCYYARDNGMRVAECSKELIQSLREEVALSAQMEAAFQREEFLLYLHFFVDAQTEKIVGAEALSRWKHPDKGLIFPGKYTALMEKEHSISRLDYYMLNKVCKLLEELRGTADGFFVSCNISRETFNSPDFASICMQIMENYQFPRESLILELTESVALKNAEGIYRNAIQLKQYGVAIALDDFGTGYSDFFALEKFPFDGLKIDKGLIDRLNTEAGQVILKGIIEIGHNLGITILAEGAETKEQASLLQAMNCDVIQGFYYYQPLSVQEAQRIYKEQR